VIATLLLGAPIAAHEEDLRSTHYSLNARYWISMPEQAKQFSIAGFYEGIQASSNFRPPRGLDDAQGEFYNRFNHTNISNPNTLVTSGSFWTITSVLLQSRNIQLSERIRF
jgi:hypothetical protein